ncbi:MAG: DNA polymerase III subunit delta [Candidatus Brocadiia bacterium]|jgi:DNA polymerase-3 subunit delta
MNFSELPKHLASGELDPVYLVAGPEDFLRTEAVRLLREKAALGKEPCDTFELDAAEGEPLKLLDDLRTPSLFAPRRLVLIENAALLLDRAPAPLLRYVEQPSPRTTLVLVAGEARKSARKPSKKPKKEPPKAAAQDKARVLRKITTVQCPVVPQKALAGWCVQRARALGKPMESNAAALLADRIGTNLGQMDGQIRNLIACCKERPRITEKDVADLCGGDRLWLAWELAEMILDRKTPQALRALDRLIRDGDSPQGLLVPIGRNIRRLIVIKQLARQGLKEDEIARRAGAQPWLIGKLLREKRGLAIPELKDMLHQVLRADVDCKTGGGRDTWILERLVLKLCAGH